MNLKGIYQCRCYELELPAPRYKKLEITKKKKKKKKKKKEDKPERCNEAYASIQRSRNENHNNREI